MAEPFVRRLSSLLDLGPRGMEKTSGSLRSLFRSRSQPPHQNDALSIIFTGGYCGTSTLPSAHTTRRKELSCPFGDYESPVASRSSIQLSFLVSLSLARRVPTLLHFCAHVIAFGISLQFGTNTNSFTSISPYSIGLCSLQRRPTRPSPPSLLSGPFRPRFINRTGP